MNSNPVLQQLPDHLKVFITDQNYHLYTPRDHAVWRYVMRQSLKKLPSIAHHSYVEGLRKTGISIDAIPSIEQMNEILGRIGWAAIAVDGFIPPAAFMEFQQYRVLVIAADIRSVDQIEYTPAPDIIHEAAGHAPIIADPEYAHYLMNFGAIGAKAFSSKQDYQLYEAIRHLSILKADPNTTAQEIAHAEAVIEELGANMGMPSEMARIRNLHWWTVEYGLIGTLEDPRIYGAGLLSSIGESLGAMKPEVEKIAYSIEAMHYNFDITKPQPQLFVTPDFKTLNEVLEEYANQMALRTGGLEGMLKALASENLATAVFSSGIQVSGIFDEVVNEGGQIVYIHTAGPTTLSLNDKVLEGHGKETHAHGFGSPVGRLLGALKPIRFMSDEDLQSYDIETGKPVKLVFESGLVVAGMLKAILRDDSTLLLMKFTDCSVTYAGRVLFAPEWGDYDMAVGEAITSVFNGPADHDAYCPAVSNPQEKTHKIIYSAETKHIHSLYEQAEQIRKAGTGELADLWKEVVAFAPDEWLLITNIYELARQHNDPLVAEIRAYLEQLVKRKPTYGHLISNVVELLPEVDTQA